MIYALLCLAALSFVHGTVVKNLLAVSGIALWCGGFFALKTFRPALVSMAVYLVAHAVAVPFLSWGHGDIAEWFQITLIGTRKTLCVAVIAFAAYALRKVDYRPFFELAVPICSIATMLGHPPSPFNPSLNAALLVTGFAVTPAWVSAFFLVPVVLFWNQGLTAPVMFFVWFALQAKERVTIAGIALTGFFGTLLCFPHAFTNKSDRLEMYRLAWEHFIQKMNIFLGGGLDSFLIIGPKIQAPGPLPWTTLHSSWLQIPFELGIVGLALAIWLYADSIWKSEGGDRDALILLGVCAAGYFPAQVPLFLALGIWLVVRAETKEVEG